MRVKDPLIKDVIYLILMLHEASFLLYTNIASIEAALRRYKRWQKYSHPDLRALLDSTSGESLGKWTIRVRDPYIFLE